MKIVVDYREMFETWADTKNFTLRRSERGYYLESHVEYAFMGFCAALGIDYLSVP